VGEPMMSLMEMQLVGVNGETALIYGENTIALDPASAARLNQFGKKELLVGVRPDKASVSLEKSSSSIQGEVYSRQLLGADVLVEVEIGGSRVRAKADTSFSGNDGEPCHLSLNSEDLYFFDAGDGVAIPRQ